MLCGKNQGFAGTNFVDRLCLDVVVVVLKLSGESVLLSGMDVEVFEKGKNSRKRFTIYVTLRNVHKDV